jgi:hypothetical protein
VIGGHTRFRHVSLDATAGTIRCLVLCKGREEAGGDTMLTEANSS